MSIRQVQIKNILDLVAKAHFVDGRNPQLDDLFKYTSKFFSQQPPALPYKMALDAFRGSGISDPELVNEFMALMITNLDTLYETCFDQIDQILTLNTVLANHLERLKIKRSVLSSRIDDHLLGLFNADGYFYSFSDDFSSSDFIDFDLTSAYLDLSAGVIAIPAISSLSKIINPDALAVPSVRVTNTSGEDLQYTVKTDFRNAVDGLTNTAWYLEVKTNEPGPIIADVNILLSSALSDNLVTKIDLTPFGTKAVQCGINAVYQSTSQAAKIVPFSSVVKTSADKMVFIADQPQSSLSEIRLQLVKNEADYFLNDDNNRTNVFIFGFKEIVASEQYFDPTATYVSTPISLPDAVKDEAAIDAISLVVDAFEPTGTELTYYVAADVSEADSIDDFNWIEIKPLSGIDQSHIVRFNGANKIRKVIRKTPRSAGDLQMFLPNSTSQDLAKRNPTPAYFPSLDVYRVVGFQDEFLSGTLKLTEGINTTRIYYVNLDANAVVNDFEFWKDKFDDPTSYTLTYGEIDAGHEFFYGADIGSNGVSAYVETFLYAEEELPVILKECRKFDSNAKTWTIKVFLNGREIADMPAGVDKLTVPWKFKEGKNHVVVMVNIPEYSGDNTAPYLGTFNIMADSNLFDYGTVKLDDWTYVDPYKFENNKTNISKTFTIFNNEIVTQKEPTTNFEISYSQATNDGPDSVRLRVDFRRFSSYANVTPIIDSYRVRFAYS